MFYNQIIFCRNKPIQLTISEHELKINRYKIASAEHNIVQHFFLKKILAEKI